MIIAAVLNEKKIIVPIVEGKVLRVYNSKKKTYEDLENPAIYLKEGRRGAALGYAKEKGAEAFVAPPQTFCDLSYEKAKNDGIQFYQLEESILFEQFEEKIKSNQLWSQSELPDNEIAPSF
ncbi:hypothetical protein [Oceanobacillus sp. Castelsardo]|uniref:hypothetical protein n=1 Tax=Oceanobacillus sp. Castelsardo TaxID=1851204 RepID=UPI0008381D8B|nr:hypothetical protein [Oceanobacillus sp. Castelsardo]